MGIEPTQSAWKAEVLPLNYTRFTLLHQTAQAIYNYACLAIRFALVEGEGFEPSKAEPSDLQSDPFDRSGTPPKNCHFLSWFRKSQALRVTKQGSL